VAFLFKTQLPPAYSGNCSSGIVADASAMEKVFEGAGSTGHSRVHQMTPKPYRGISVREALAPFASVLTRRADSMIKAAENRSLIGKVVGVCSYWR